MIILYSKQLYSSNDMYQWLPHFTSFAACIDYWLGSQIFHKIHSFWSEEIRKLLNNEPWIYQINTQLFNFTLCIKWILQLITLTIEFPVCLTWYIINTKNYSTKRKRMTESRYLFKHFRSLYKVIISLHIFNPEY